jgi:hypothetical protein
MPIERTPSGGYIATVQGFPRVEVPLPSPDRLKADAIAALLSSGDPADGEAAGMLHRCDLAYDVAFGDDGEELIEVVIAAPEDVRRVLEDHSHPAVGAFMFALTEICPDIGAERVVPRGDPA